MPGLYSHANRATGLVLTAAIYNADHQNHIDNQTPQMTDDYSTNQAQMQSAVDPGEVGTESLPTSLAGELERLRFAVQDLKLYIGLTSAQWYVTPTGTVALAKGGTGATTAAAARTALGVSEAGAPQNSQSAAYTTVLADAQKHILHPTADNNARTFTIDSNANVAYPIGTSITFVNQINVLSIAITSDTMTLAGTTSTGTRTLAVNGIATALKISATGWLISGVGIA